MRGGVLVLAVCASAAACNQSGIPLVGDGGGGDLSAAVGDLNAPAGDLAGFCGDPASPRAALNGMLAASPAVNAVAIVLNCCDSAEIGVTSMQLSDRFFVAWRHQAGSGPDVPITFDVANPPMGWSVSLYSGCSVIEPGCVPTDRYFDGLSGTLSVSRSSGGSYQMSTCLSASESASTSPHPVVHSASLWVPSVATQ